jgi:choline dehydrogenase-like flavoprotein
VLSASPTPPSSLPVLDTDVCIVGSGPAGVALAHELAGTAVRVLVLESGGDATDGRTDTLNDGDNAGDRPLDLQDGRARAFGGAGRLWAGQCIRLDAADFEARAWVPHSGWPIGLSDLAPYYVRAERFFDVSGEASHDARSLYEPFGLEPLAVDARTLRHVASVFAPAPDVGQTYRPALARAANVQLRLRTTLTRLVRGETPSIITGAEARDGDGGLQTIRARAFVLCGGGIENARLLLASDGLGNDHDLVGRFLLEHPNGRAGVILADRRALLQDRFGLLYRRPWRFYPKLSLAADVQRREQVLNCALMINSDFGERGIEAARRLVRAVRRGARPAGMARDVLSMALDAPRMLRTAYRRYARGLSPTSRDSVIWLQTYAEQAPNPESRVRLSDRRDAFGVPLPRVEWRFTDLDRRTAEVMVQTTASELARLGVGRVEPAEWLSAAGGRWFDGIHDAYHPSGTTRMADEPTRGVVDRQCRVHGLQGVYVAGSSVFPTVGFANPTLTIVALAIRLADHLKQHVFVGAPQPHM